MEIVPGVGKAIITDDAYGYSLRRLIDDRLTPKSVHRPDPASRCDGIHSENHIQHVPITPRLDNIH